MIVLSVLIPTLDDRKTKREALVEKILRSASNITQIEILPLSDNRELSTGSKRQQLLWMAQGKFCSFVDDDDDVNPRYCDLILSALAANPDADCCSLNGIVRFSDGYERKFVHSLAYDGWIDDHKTKVYYRPPNHLNAIKTEYARMVGFPSINVGEDRVFSAKIRPLLWKEAPVDEWLYLYNARGTFEEIHGGLSRDYTGDRP